MGVPVAVGVIVGLAASFIQSLGLTIQRLSHLSNERLAPPSRKRDWQRPLWLFGLSIFLVSNVAGTLFQIGTLPLVVLGPLGAVSLVCNALFARLLLGDAFSIQLAIGSVLIAAGATLVGIFGTVPEQTHTLPELVDLYRRPAFLAWLAALSVALALVVGPAHWAEWRLAKRLADLPPGTPKLARRRGMSRHRRRPRHARSWSLPTHHASPLPSSAATTALRDSAQSSEREPLLPPPSSRSKRAQQPPPSTRFSNRIDPVRPRALDLPPPPSFSAPTTPQTQRHCVEEVLRSAERTRLWLAIAYGATSGTLSGLCLLFTKTGMDLVIQTLVNRNNQFGHLEAWALLIVLLVCELAQLSYLNRALRLVGPTLVCPTAFCFYNAASILSGLIYYRQLDALRPLQGSLVGVGSAVLLGGVWIVSVKPAKKEGGSDDGEEAAEGRDKLRKVGSEREDADAGSGLSMDEMGEEEEDQSAESDEDDELGNVSGLLFLSAGILISTAYERTVPYRPRGFSIGISAASPGFEIRPSSTATPHRRSRLSLDAATTPSSTTDELAWSTSSLPAPPAASPTRGLLDSPKTLGLSRTTRNRRSYGHRREGSLTGAPYVGQPPYSHVLGFSDEPLPYVDGRGDEEQNPADDDGLGAAPEGTFAAAATKAKSRWWWTRWLRSSTPPPSSS
ncbi:hypothetical protein JCM10908_001518 [Rhodotorula pacifica]|uniref:uncharacterized protein n=1 Tax=Rhodotorula pacifica TaxID=1495444 RepID=UPI00316D2D24